MLIPATGSMLPARLIDVPESLRSGYCINEPQLGQLLSWFLKLEELYYNYCGGEKGLQIHWHADAVTGEVMVTDLGIRVSPY